MDEADKVKVTVRDDFQAAFIRVDESKTKVRFYLERDENGHHFSVPSQMVPHEGGTV